MTLANEAAYLYIYAKKLAKINGRLQSATAKVQKQASLYQTTNSPKPKEKHRRKYEEVKRRMQQLQRERAGLITRLRHHQTAFAHGLQKE